MISAGTVLFGGVTGVFGRYELDRGHAAGPTWLRVVGQAGCPPPVVADAVLERTVAHW